METPNTERPSIPKAKVFDETAPAEAFQNSVLRPIIKMQSDLLMVHIRAQLITLKVVWDELNTAKKKAALTSLLTKDHLVKSEIVGMVVGHLSVAEYEIYRVQYKELNKRVTQMVLNRAIDLMV